MTDECTVDVSKCTISQTTTTTTKATNSKSSATSSTTQSTRTISTQQEQKLSKRKEKMQAQAENATDEKTITTKMKTTTTKTANHGQANGKCIKNGFGDIHIMQQQSTPKPHDDKPDAFGFNIGGSENGIKNKVGHVARMPTTRTATEYNMNHKYRGLALIFNHETFDIPDLSKRSGTDKDCSDLRETLQQLHFEVSVHKDCKLKEIIQEVDKVAALDHTDNDCLIIAILSHGDHGYLYACDVQYKLDSLAHHFTAHACPSLAGKPKLFFIQACRGDNFDAGIELQRKTETDGESSTSYKIPVHADFLFAYSTIPGFYSWRSPENGSWFIQALVHELRTNGKVHDILTLLTFVNQRVAFDKESYVPGNHMMHNQKQIPCITSMLTRILRFNDKNEEN